MTIEEPQFQYSNQATRSSSMHQIFALRTLTETLAPTAWPFCSRTADWTYGLSLKAATLDEATPSSVQCSKAHSGSRRPDYRTQNGGPPTAYSRRQRSGVGSRGNT